MNPHLHKYTFECNTKNNHIHKTTGYTDNMIGFTALHFHYFFGISSYNGHTHYYSGFTGLPVKTGKGHIHKIEGVLEINNMHEHEFSSHTFPDTAYVSGPLIQEAYI